MNLQKSPSMLRGNGTLQILNNDRILLLVEDVGLETTLRVIERSKIDFRHYLLVLLDADKPDSHNDLRLAYHSIAGVAAMFGADKLHSIASQAEFKIQNADCELATRYKCDVVDAILQYLEALQKFQIQAIHTPTQTD